MTSGIVLFRLQSGICRVSGGLTSRSYVTMTMTMTMTITMTTLLLNINTG